LKRQVVLIGVQKPGGGLGALRSIGKCLADMRDWALSQKIAPQDIKIFTDVPELLEPGAGVLSIDDIYKWIEAQAQSWQPADQLLIYFSGHGMLVGGSTLWLLPQAPDKAWEAVNLDASKELAVWSKFGHIVFIGDCCATVADNEQFDMVKGAPILRNVASQERTKDKPVDFLRAARPGKASLEVIVGGVSLSPYTVQLVTTLGGTPADILEAENPGTAVPLVLRIRKLADQLKISVNAYLRSIGVAPAGPPLDTVVSTTEWIALFPQLPLPPEPPAHTTPPPEKAPPPLDAAGPDTPGDEEASSGPSISSADGGQASRSGLNLDESLIHAAKVGAASFVYGDTLGRPSLIASLNSELTGLANGSLTEVQGEEWSSAIPDGYHFETECGFYITGASVVSATSRPDVDCQAISSYEVRVNPEKMELAAIEFEGGGGVMVPAIAGQIGFLHLERGQLESLAYEPSGHASPNQKSTYRREFDEKSSQVRNLRDTLLNVITSGDLSFANVEPETVVDVLNKTNYASSLDFSSILYMAYLAYSSQATRPTIASLAKYSQDRFGFVPFDLKILLDLSQSEIPADMRFEPPFPILTQGWSLLQATHEELPAGLEELPDHYRNAAWTHFDAEGLELCRAYLEQQTESGSHSGGGTVISAEIAPAPIVEAVDNSAWFERAATLENYRAGAQAGARDDDEQQELTTSADW
jgi:hypothetical protein